MKNYIVFDLEWNQSAQGKEGSIDNFPFEIIEIGAVKLDTDFRIVSEFHRLIKPQVYQQMHFKIMEVIHMDMQELQNEGKDFKAVAQEFIDWCGDDFCFCTWGAMDVTELQRNMSYYRMNNPFPNPLLYYDIQKLYSLSFGDGKIKPSLDAAAEELGIPKDRPFHRALDDACYTGIILSKIDWKKMQVYRSIDYYRLPEKPEDEVYLKFPTYSKYVSRIFDTKEDAIADKAVTDMLCCRCNRMLRKKIRWFSTNQKFYFCLAYCPEHGYIKGKIRMKRTEDGRVYVVKTSKSVEEEGVEDITNRKEETKKRRTEKNKLRRLSKKLGSGAEDAFSGE